MPRKAWRRCSGALLCSFLGCGAASAQEPDSATPALVDSSTTNETDTPIAHGLQLAYGVDAGIGETDNIKLTPTDKISQTIAITDLDFNVKERSARLDANARGDFSYLDFLQGAYGSELVGRFDGTAELALIQDRLTWRFQDDFGQAQLDPFSPVTPANRENVNYFGTGPQLLLRFGPTWFLNAGARYSRTNYQTSPFDSNRFEGDIAVGSQLSALSSVSLDGTYERVLFTTTVIDDEIVNRDFSRSSVFGKYELQGARTTLTANLGVTKVDQGVDSQTGPSAKLRAERKLSSVSKLVFTLGRTLTDASAGFGSSQSGVIPAVGTAPASQALVNYTETYATAEWNYTRNRTSLFASGNWERDEYSKQPALNLTRAGLQLRLNRQVTRSFSADLYAGLSRVNYANPNLSEGSVTQSFAINPSEVGFAETDVQAGTNLIYHYGRGLEVRLKYDHTTRIVSGLGSGSGYQNNRIFLTVGYRPHRTGPI